MTAYLTREVAREIAGEAGLPVTSSVRDAERILTTGGTLLLLLTPTTTWQTYTDGEAAFTLVIASGPADKEDKAQENLDAALIPIMRALNALSIGVDEVAPSAYASTRGDTQTHPAYTVTFTAPINIDDLED